MKKTFTLSITVLGLFSVWSLGANAQVLNEGFESGFPPSGWTIDNPDGKTTFAESTAGHSGSKSAFLDAFDMDQSEQGQTDALITSALDLSTATSPSLSFYYAYQMYSDTSTYQSADTLRVYASTDGGTTWNSLYTKLGNALVTAAVPFDPNNAFVPASGDWKMETVDISSVATSSNVQFEFAFTNDYENNFYIDDIMISGGTTGVKNVTLAPQVNLSPNPANGPVSVDLAAFDLGQTNVAVYNMMGEKVNDISCNVTAPKRIKFNLDNQPNGVYFVKVKTGNGATSTKKLILNK